MGYRLVCIYETQEHQFPQLRIEVCLDSGSGRSITPFQRKVSLNDIFRQDRHSPLLPLLDHSGLLHQPFRIDNRLLQNNEVVSLLRDYPYTFIQQGGKGSVKKGRCPLPLIHGATNISVGRLLQGELYIDSLTSWHKKIRVRLRYTDAISDFSPVYSSVPFLSLSGQLLQRDQQAEVNLLSSLGDAYDSSTTTLSFSDFDTDRLEDLIQQGWKVYVPNQSKSHSQVYAHHESSGIVWFSTDEKANNSNFAQQLLDGYLHQRNYQESDGNITLFKRQDAEKSDDKVLTSQLGVPFDAQQLYTEDLPLSDTDISTIDSILSSKLKVTLRSYQRDGVLWLQQQRKNNHGCLLADEMGLGKTIQIIAHLCCLNTSNRHLVIAPTSLIYNWQHEVTRFAPHLLSQFVFVSYDYLRIHLDDYISEAYDTIIIDEAQVIKNRLTKKYQAISQLHCQHKIILTGTPIENSIDELWSHFMMLMPPMQGLYQRLHALGVPSVPEVYVSLSSKLLKPFILRRVKQQVLTDLPERTEKTIYIELSEQERTIYRRVHAAILQAFATGLSGRISSIALEGLLRLRQACVSPSLLPSSVCSDAIATPSSKLQTALDYIEQFRSEHRQVLIFSQFVSALHEMEQFLSQRSVRFVTLYGDTHDRSTPVAQFQTNPDITVFLISLKAGGVGLNLTAADRVILLDDWWNPAVEDQAMGRAHRIGQQRNVLVLRLVCKDTVEEKILQLQDQKRNTVNLFNATSDKLSLEELKALID